METNTAKHAEIELNILCKTVKKPILKPFIPEILELCEKFGKSGQSGGSAPTTAAVLANAIKKLLLQEPITKITGIDEEWMDVTELNEGNTLYQNKRHSAIFKDNAGAYYLDAIAFKDEHGSLHSYKAFLPYLKHRPEGAIYSRQYIKKFPFEPKTFYIDVIEKEVAKNDWEYYIKDEKQLNAVFKYYTKYSI